MLVFRSLLADLLTLAGITCLTVGGWWLAPWVGMVVLGLGLIVLAWTVDPPRQGTVIALPPEEEEPEPVQSPEYREAIGGIGLEWGPQQ